MFKCVTCNVSFFSCEFIVVCKVGEVVDPGVSPYFQIFSEDDETGKIMLRDGYPKQHAFKKGNTYKISLKNPDVGEVRFFTCDLLGY